MLPLRRALPTKEKIAKLHLDGDKERMMPLLETAKDEIAAETIVNEILIEAMTPPADSAAHNA